jgi:hypothetical protein
MLALVQLQDHFSGLGVQVITVLAMVNIVVFQPLKQERNIYSVLMPLTLGSFPQILDNL